MANNSNAGMASNQSSQKLPKLKAVWSNELHKTFVELCSDRMKKGYKQGTFFTKDGWKYIISEFNKRAGKDYDKKQMKNHWDNTKAEWKIWYKLKDYETGLGWDCEKNTVIASDDWWKEYIQGCIGAIDGTHIDAIVPISEQLAYRGRKGKCTQNVMAACSFDMLFTFVWAGWEGSAHDSRIFTEAINHPTLNFPRPNNGKYYLVDAGYPNMLGFLAPYKNTRYHLQSFQTGGQVNGVKELFNCAHSLLRNVIERCFGVWKARFPILKCMAPYPFKTQRLIIVASMVVHNFIRQEAIADAEFRRYDLNEEYVSDDEVENNDDLGNPNGTEDDQLDEMGIVRNAIANSILISRGN